MMTTCGICGKRFVVPWPQHWVYKRKDVFLCGEDCMIVYDTQQTRKANGFGPKKTRGAEEDMAGKLTQKQREEVVEIAIQGGSPIEYLKKCGIGNPWASWDWIKKSLAKKDPVKHNRLLQVETLKHAGIPLDAKLKFPMKVKGVKETAAGLEVTVTAKKVDKVPPVEIPEQSVSMAPTPLILQGGVDYQMKVDEMEAEAADLFKIIGVETSLGSYARGNVSRNVIYFRRSIDESDVIEVAMVEDDWRQLARELPKVLKTLGVDA